MPSWIANLCGPIIYVIPDGRFENQFTGFDPRSIRQIASATGLSASRVHQVVNTEEPEKTPAWRNAKYSRCSEDAYRRAD
jgi:hypothetical protein